MAQRTHMSAARQQEIDRLNRLLLADPEIQRLMALGPDTSQGFDSTAAALGKRIEAVLGGPLPDGLWFSNGQVTTEPNKFLDTALPLMVGAGLGVGGFNALTATPGVASTTAPVVSSVAPTTTASTTAGVLPSTVTTSTAGTLPVGGAGITTGGGLLSGLGSALNGRVGDMLANVGRGIGDATQAAGNNREIANNQRESAQREYNRSLNERSVIESNQRNDAEKDVYRAGWYANRRPSPLNTAGVQPTSANYTSTLSALESEGMRRLETPPQYSTDRMPAVEKFVPQGPGAAETAGTWTAPILSTLGNLFRRTQPKPAGS